MGSGEFTAGMTLQWTSIPSRGGGGGGGGGGGRVEMLLVASNADLTC